MFAGNPRQEKGNVQKGRAAEIKRIIIKEKRIKSKDLWGKALGIVTGGGGCPATVDALLIIDSMMGAVSLQVVIHFDFVVIYSTVVVVIVVAFVVVNSVFL